MPFMNWKFDKLSLKNTIQMLKMKTSCFLLAQLILVNNFCFAQNESLNPIRLNQVGFYPNGNKTAIVLTSTTGSIPFSVKSTIDAKTVFNGILGEPKVWDLSGETVRVADFSALTTSGTYVLDVQGIGASYFVNIKPNAHFEISRAAMKAFYFNRVSIPIEEEFAGIYKRKAGHPDQSLTILPSAASGARPAGTIISSPKGWYDAGDYNSYIVNSGISVYSLLSAYQDFKGFYDTLKLNIPESKNSIPDILDEVRWNLDWMLTMQDPNDGGVYNKKTNANFDGFIMPDKALNARYITAKGSAASFDFAAVMALAYRVYKPFDPQFAQTCLTASKSAYEWGVANPNIPFTNPPAQDGYPGVVTGEYGDGYLEDEYEWASSELYISTKKDEYYFRSFKSSNTYSVPEWPGVRTLGLMSLIKNRKDLSKIGLKDTSAMKKKLLEIANKHADFQQVSPYKVPMGAGGKSDFVWGSNAVAANQGMVLLNAYLLTKNAKYYNAALAQLDYLLGRNPSTYCYVTGFGSKKVMFPHHRPSDADGIVDPVPGWLSGGPQNNQDSDKCYNDPNPAKAFVDQVPCYTKNEVAINWNAPFVYLSAGIEVLK